MSPELRFVGNVARAARVLGDLGAATEHIADAGGDVQGDLELLGVAVRSVARQVLARVAEKRAAPVAANPQVTWTLWD